MSEKIRYKVYIHRFTDDGYGNKTEAKFFVGETYAPSEKKAISNMKYRLHTKERADRYKGAEYDKFVAIPA